MLRTVGKTLGGALALLCLTSALALAQGEAMVCAKDNGMGTCIAGTGLYGKTVVVIGEGVKMGQTMACHDRGYMISCELIETK